LTASNKMANCQQTSVFIAKSY